YDVQNSHAVVGQMGSAQRATVLKREYTPGQLLSLLRHFELAMGMRLHFLEFSALAGVPFMPLPYAGKVLGLLEALNMPPPPFTGIGAVSAGQLIALISRCWDERERIAAHVQAQLPELIRRARINHELALGLLGMSAETARAPATAGRGA